MPDNTAAAKRRASAVERMAGLAALPAADPEQTAERSERSKRAATESRRQAPPTTARTIRAAAMPAETPKPATHYAARVSHKTTLDQLETLEEIASAARKADSKHRAVPLTALLRAAAQICIDDVRLRDRMVRLARTEWR